MKILFVGGSGEISLACVEDALLHGHEVSVFNRGLREELRETELLKKVVFIQGDLSNGDAYASLEHKSYDVVCQFMGFTVAQVEKDIRFFSKRCSQYIFISTASAYQKPWHEGLITESTPLHNPYWEYSRVKAACEERLMQAYREDNFPVTIVRPSHTYRTRLPSTVIDGDHFAWRVLKGKPVIVHDGGQSLWTLTHASDFARALTVLCGCSQAIGEAVHITDTIAHSWQSILNAAAAAMNKDVTLCSIDSRELVKYNPLFEGPLLGDKSNNLQFDNSKISKLTGGWRCELTLEQGLNRVWPLVEQKMLNGYSPNVDVDKMVDKIIFEQ